MNDSILRENIIELLKGGHAHVSAEQALEGIDPALRNVRPANEMHSIWEELEHSTLPGRRQIFLKAIGRKRRRR
jgi:hypothetical protein